MTFGCFNDFRVIGCLRVVFLVGLFTCGLRFGVGIMQTLGVWVCHVALCVWCLIGFGWCTCGVVGFFGADVFLVLVSFWLGNLFRYFGFVACGGLWICVGDLRLVGWLLSVSVLSVSMMWF